MIPLCSAFSGKFVATKDEGVYNCVVCGNPLFASETKFDSKSGWPAFHDVIDRDKVILKVDTAHGRVIVDVYSSYEAWKSTQR